MRLATFPATVALLLNSAAIVWAADVPPATGAATPQAVASRVPSLDELFSALDRDHDGRISKEEATGVYAARFSQWDADGDGFATRQEIHDFRTRMGIDDNGNRIVGLGAGVPRRPAKTATVLKEPADWRLETMLVPPGFAPDVELTGTEEIRFAPGMFDNTSATYFTCALAIVVDGAPALEAPAIRDFLEKYYRGLSISRAQRSKLSVDVAQMKANVTAVPAAKDRFDADVVFFDSFSDGRKVTLHVEAQVVAQPSANRTCLILLVSPSAKESDVWPSLREIGKKAASNVTP